MLKILTKEQMTKLNTKRLLAYKNRLMQVPAGPDQDDFDTQINKKSPEWIECYNALKEILSTREHIE